MGWDFRGRNLPGSLLASPPLHPALGEGGPGWAEEPWELASTHQIPWVEAALPLRGQQGQVAQTPLEFRGDNGKRALWAVSACQRLKLRHPIQSSGAKQKLILKAVLGKSRGKRKRDFFAGTVALKTYTA